MCDVERNLGRVALMSPFLHLLLFFNVDVLLFCESPSWFQANRRNWEVVHFLPGCEVLSFQAELRLLWQTFQSVTRIHEYKVISLREVSSHLGVIFEWPGPNGRNGRATLFIFIGKKNSFPFAILHAVWLIRDTVKFRLDAAYCTRLLLLSYCKIAIND